MCPLNGFHWENHPKYPRANFSSEHSTLAFSERAPRVVNWYSLCHVFGPTRRSSLHLCSAIQVYWNIPRLYHLYKQHTHYIIQKLYYDIWVNKDAFDFFPSWGHDLNPFGRLPRFWSLSSGICGVFVCKYCRRYCCTPAFNKASIRREESVIIGLFTGDSLTYHYRKSTGVATLTMAVFSQVKSILVGLYMW